MSSGSKFFWTFSVKTIVSLGKKCLRYLPVTTVYCTLVTVLGRNFLSVEPNRYLKMLDFSEKGWQGRELLFSSPPFHPHSNAWYRAKTELVQLSAYRGGSHRRNVANSHIPHSILFGYISPQWAGRECFTCSNYFTCLRGGRGEGSPCGSTSLYQREIINRKSIH